MQSPTPGGGTINKEASVTVGSAKKASEVQRKEGRGASSPADWASTVGSVESDSLAGVTASKSQRKDQGGREYHTQRTVRHAQGRAIETNNISIGRTSASRPIRKAQGGASRPSSLSRVGGVASRLCQRSQIVKTGTSTPESVRGEALRATGTIPMTSIGGKALSPSS